VKTKAHKSLKKLLFLLLFIAVSSSLVAQLQLVRYDSITVTKDGDTLAMAWAGGFNSPQFSAIDLNGDGIQDLFAFERNFYGMPKTFINKGIAGEVSYFYDPFYQKAFPKMSNWALLADYNCDGEADIFTNVPFGVAVYRNEFQETTYLSFTKVSALLQTSINGEQEPLYVSPPDLPALTDIDGDGDLDFLTFDILGKYVEYHQNQSIQNTGTCNDLDFNLESRCWGYFSENETNNGIKLYDTCESLQPVNPENERHAGSVLLALDLNGNGLKDLVIGDIANNNLVALLNDGTLAVASMQSVDTAFPSNSIPVNLTTFPAGFYLDVNNDNKKDLLVTPNNPNTSENINNILFYENKGTASNPDFEFQTNSFLQEEMIDVGAGAKPVFFDYNNDGLLDLVIGNFGYFQEGGSYLSALSLYENTGTQTSPVFSFVTNDYSNLSVLDLNGIYPAFGDLNGDGKAELITGDEEGNLYLFSDISEEGQPASFVLTQPKYKNIDVGQTAMPQLVDVNRDGKTDLLIGERGGTINYFENTGTTTQPDFASTPTNDFFGGIDVMLECCTGYSAPFFTEDSVGNSLLYVGSEAGNLFLYNNIDQNLEGSFNLVDSLFLYGLQINLSGADINNDGKTELVYGEYAGGVTVLKNGTPEFLSFPEKKFASFEVLLYPNPVTSKLTVQVQNIPEGKKLKMALITIFGETVEEFNSLNRGKNSISVKNLKKGIYFVKVTSDNQTITKKIIIQ
jgi:hypothetical protein